MAQLTTEQRRAVEARGKLVCVDAGAGSGKTRVLVQRIVDLIERDRVELNRIAAITFTDKAANEMKERLRRACREKAPKDDPEKLSFWRRMERLVDLSRICTIHTFCSGILRENALSLRLDPDFAVLTDPESEVIRSEVVTAALHALLESDNPEAHLAAREYGLYALTEIVHELIAQRGSADSLIGDGVGVDNIGDAWSRKLPIVEAELLRIVVRSRKLRYFLNMLDGYAGHCSDPSDKRESVRAALAGLLRQLTREREAAAIRSLIAQIRGLRADAGKKSKGVLVNWESEEVHDDIKDILNKVKDHLKTVESFVVDPEGDARAAEVTAAVLHVYRHAADALRDAKRTRNALDFDDLIAKAAVVLRDGAKGEDSVRARTARTLRHVLIDEFQDTDSVQYEIARQLSDAPGGPDLFIVGDAKQSIYYFRGAEVDVFRQARNEAGSALPMLGNFRTGPNVLAFVNDFFASSDLLAAVESPFAPLVQGRDAYVDGAVEFLVPEAREGAPIDSYRQDEALMIAASLAEIATGSVTVVDANTRETRPARFGDAAILLRSLSNVHLYERALREAGIPYSLVAGKGFYERQEVIDLRNLLAILADACDEMALTAFLRGPIAGLSDDALVALAGGIGAPRGVLAGFVSDAALDDAEQNDRLRSARELVARLRTKVEQPLHEFLQTVFDLTGLEGIVLRQFMGPQRVSNLRKVAALADSFSGAQPPSLRAFVRYLDDMAAREIREGDAAANTDDTQHVTVMTVHKAKGLEFPIVYVADLGREPRASDSRTVVLHKDYGIAAKIVGPDGEYQAPAMHRGISSIRADEELAEHARLLYVAMTRARDHLHLCGAPVKPGSASWMGAFDEQYGVCAFRDGEEVTGSGWKATVRRGLSKRTEVKQAAAEPPDVDIARIRLRIGPLPEPVPERSTIPVTELLYAICGDAEISARARGASYAAGVSSLKRGTLFHAFFERWDFRADPEAAIQSVLRGESLDDGAARAFAHDVAQSVARLRGSGIWERIANAAQLDREVPFLLRIDGFVVRGALDLILDGNTIVDYKTGIPSEDELRRYETQIQLYAAALRELAGTHASRAYLIMLDRDGNVVHEVDVSPSAVDRALQLARSALPALVASCAAG